MVSCGKNYAKFSVPTLFIRENKNTLVNYINALHIFSKNLGVHNLNLFPFFLIPKLQECGKFFEK